MMPVARYLCIFINVGLGEAAKRNVGTGENQIPSMSEWTSGTGWNRDPSGRIIQRGFAMTSSQTNILFPIPFPYDDFEVIVCAADTGANKGAVNVLRKSRQGFSVSQVGSMPVAYRWIAG
ncbi:TPA: phage tail protein [Escherichia coli]|nr:phage tail protein [Salmonella enterica subsp. enterica serovar Infantis]EAQ1495601.1 phage tail protein [Salmonella enterica]HAH3622539.1 phage tail protein [Escherichia coli]